MRFFKRKKKKEKEETKKIEETKELPENSLSPEVQQMVETLRTKLNNQEAQITTFKEDIAPQMAETIQDLREKVDRLEKRIAEKRLIPRAFKMIGAPMENQNRYGLGFRKLAMTPFFNDCGRT